MKLIDQTFKKMDRNNTNTDFLSQNCVIYIKYLASKFSYYTLTATTAT